MSRWTKPRSCAAAIARAACATRRAAARGGSAPLRRTIVGEVLALDELHDDERADGVGAVVVHGDHARVVQRRGRLRLVPEAVEEVRVGAVLGPQDLDRDVALELGVAGPVDRGHAALAEQLDEAVATAEDGRRCRSQVEASEVGAELGCARSGRWSARSTVAWSQPIVVPAS